ncbi:uncharacterized protein ARMOST_15419 [Armillaria ostoyae]|uniref:Uncharacterized protein n=1 Tax=Armillaria ostoyae TaxID=47428 RepID=A0A284RTA1_ARMOS|nr:uncharacterized protein ARMOST_15419 [Armillaria ostoyae]
MTNTLSPAVVGQNPSTTQSEDAIAKRRAERQPLITKKFEADSLMRSTLNAPVTVPMGELMACSPELRKRIIRELQYRSVRIAEPTETGSSHYLDVTDSEPAKVNLVRMDPIRVQPITRAPLIIISVNLGIGGRQLIVKAIVDSGSEINIVCQTVARELNKQYPITPLREIRCSDANGNEGTLHGQFNNVYIYQASIVTNAVFFVGSYNVGFQLLLGRPWIRGNLVSMDERVEGTYLVYANPSSPKEYTELLVNDEKWDAGINGTAPTLLARSSEEKFQGSWKIEEGQEIVEIGPPVTYWSFLAMQNPHPGNQHRSIPFTTPLPFHQTTRSSVTASARRRCALEYPRRQETHTVNEMLSPPLFQNRHIERLRATYRNRDIERWNYALMTLQSHWDPFKQDKNIKLTVPSQYLVESHEITLYNRIHGERVHYPRIKLPLWSVLGLPPDTDDESKTHYCSQKDIFDAFDTEIRRLGALTRQRKRFQWYKERHERRGMIKTPNSDHSSFQKQHVPILMPQPMPIYSADRDIRNRLRAITNNANEADTVNVIPPNRVPRPAPLSNSSEYFPILDSLGRTQLRFLRNSLSHPDVTTADSFHAILLSANNALRLETEVFDGQRLQRTHAFNATLAELRGPDGLPISSRVGHAVILFFPGEYERESSFLDNRVKTHRVKARLGEEIVVHGHYSGPDSDDNDASVNSDDSYSSINSSRETSSEDLSNYSVQIHRSIPQPRMITSPTNATAGSSRAPSAHHVIDDIEVQTTAEKGRLVHTFVCRLASNPRNRSAPAQAPSNQFINEDHPIHLVLPPMFLVLTTRIIEIKRDEACEIFRIPTDYGLVMRLNEPQLTRRMNELPREMVLRMDYTTRTLIKAVNEKGCALLLHNPLFLITLHQTLFPCRASSSDDTPVSHRMPYFRPEFFILEGSGITARDTPLTDTPPPLVSVDSSDPEDGEIISPRTLPPGSSYIDDCNVIPETQRTEASDGSEEHTLPPPYSSGMCNQIAFYSNNTLKTFKNFIDKMDSSPVQATASFYRPPTPMPGRCHQINRLSTTLMPISETSQPAETAQVYLTRIHSPMAADTPLKHTVSLPTLNKDAKMLQDHELDARIQRKEAELVEEDSNVEEPSQRGPWTIDTMANTPTLHLDLRLSQNPDVYASTSSESEQDSPPAHRNYPGARSINRPSPIQEDSPPEDSSSPSSGQIDSSDDANAYSPLSLDKMRRGNLKSVFYKLEPVRIGPATTLARSTQRYQPKHYVIRTSEFDEQGRNNAFTYITRKHDDQWRRASEFVPMDNGPLSPPPYHSTEYPFRFQIIHHFRGANDNSPLHDEFNGLIPPTHEKYSNIRGTEEFKISTLAIKVHEFLRDLDIEVADWSVGHPRMTQEELENVRIKVFEERNERNQLMHLGRWGKQMHARKKEDEVQAKRLVQNLPNGVETTIPSPGVVMFLEGWELGPTQEQVTVGKRIIPYTQTYSLLEDDGPYTFLDNTKSIDSSVRTSPWGPVISKIRVVRICIRRLIGLIVKQLILSQWRDSIDRLSPEDDTRHYFYRHCKSFRYLDGRYTSYMQGFNCRCVHNDPQTGTPREPRIPRNPLLTVDEDELLFHAAAIFEHEGCGELSNNIRFARGGECFMADEVRKLFEQGYVDSTIYYDDEGHHRSFRGDEYDLHYYDEED